MSVMLILCALRGILIGYLSIRKPSFNTEPESYNWLRHEIKFMVILHLPTV